MALIASLVALNATDLWLQSFDPATKPDLRFGYDLAEIVEVFRAYGAGGRRAYAAGLVVDTVYPITLAAATILLSARAFPSAYRWLSIPPAVFAVLDVVENALLALILASFPDIPEQLVTVASPITQVKLVSFAPTVVVIVSAALVLGVRWLRRRKDAHP